MVRLRSRKDELCRLRSNRAKALLALCSKLRLNGRSWTIEALSEEQKRRNRVRAARIKIDELNKKLEKLKEDRSTNEKLRSVFGPEPGSPEAQRDAERAADALNQKLLRNDEEMRAAQQELHEARAAMKKRPRSDSERSSLSDSSSNETNGEECKKKMIPRKKKTMKKRSMNVGKEERSIGGESDDDDDDEDGRGEKQKQPPLQPKNKRKYDPSTYYRTGFTRNSSEERTFNRHAERRERGEDSDTPTDLADSPYHTHNYRHRFCGCDHKEEELQAAAAAGDGMEADPAAAAALQQLEEVDAALEKKIDELG